MYNIFIIFVKSKNASTISPQRKNIYPMNAFFLLGCSLISYQKTHLRIMMNIRTSVTKFTCYRFKTMEVLL